MVVVCLGLEIVKIIRFLILAGMGKVIDDLGDRIAVVHGFLDLGVVDPGTGSHGDAVA